MFVTEHGWVLPSLHHNILETTLHKVQGNIGPLIFGDSKFTATFLDSLQPAEFFLGKTVQ
jgi:hypothetical protein